MRPTQGIQNIQVKTSYGCARVVQLDELRTIPAWQELIAGHAKDHRFYEIVDQTIRQNFGYYYLVLEDLKGVVRGIQPFFIHDQNILMGVSEAVARRMEKITKLLPRLFTMRTLMVGTTLGQGSLGTAKHDQEWFAEALHAALRPTGCKLGASLLVMKEFPSHLRPVLTPFSNNGYVRMPSLPYTCLELEFTDFEEHMTKSISKSQRKNLRRKFRDALEADPIHMEIVSDISPYVDEVYPLYLQVFEKSALQFEKLTPDYLCRIGKEMPERARFFLWRQNSKIVAFSVCSIHDDALWDEYLGMDYTVALDMHLYFYTFRDIINWCCSNGIKRYFSTPLNYDPKLHLRCDLSPVDLYVQHTNRLINPFFRRIIRFFEPTKSEPTLQHFRNAHEM